MPDEPAPTRTVRSPRLVRSGIPVVLVAVTAVVAFGRLGFPDRIFFDETYYVGDARDYLDAGVEDSFAVHPPVGKWLIAAGIATAGDGPFGWRLPGAVALSLTVLATYALGRRLFRRTAVAALAALLVATDGLMIVQARTAMLDIHLAVFVVVGAWALTVDLDRRAAGSGGAWRYVAGVAFGLAVATKWSGVFPLGAAALVVLASDLAAARQRPRPRPDGAVVDRRADDRADRGGDGAVTGGVTRAAARSLGSVAVAMAVVPAAVYLASYVPWLANVEHSTESAVCGDAAAADGGCGAGALDRLGALVDYQRDIWTFHVGLEADHAYRAPAHTWPVLGRPVVYYWENCSPERAQGIERTDPETGEVSTPPPCVVEPGEAAEILALGNPALWWAWLIAAPLTIAAAVHRHRGAAVVMTFWAVQFLPWLAVSRPVFLFYMTPVVPFLALGVAYLPLHVGLGRQVVRPLAGAAAATVVGWLLGVGLERADLAAAGSGRWLLAVAGTVAGAALGATSRWSPLPHRRRPSATAGRPRRGVVVAVVLATLAVAAFVFFLPVWTGLPLPDDVIRRRWWFRTWI